MAAIKEHPNAGDKIENYALDPNHSSINFAIRHLVINQIRGRFNDFQGTLRLAENIEQSSVEFSGKTASVNTDNQMRDEHLRGENFFDADKYPEFSFRSAKVQQNGTGLIITGDFNLRSVTKEISFNFVLSEKVFDPLTKAERIGIEADFPINRQDFGLTWNQVLESGGLALANDVHITLSLEAVAEPDA